jgi:hypothetical protein
LLNWSSRVTPTPTVPPAVIELAGWALMISWVGVAGLTVIELVVAVETPLRLVSEAMIVTTPVLVIWRPLNVATPLEAVTEVVPAEKLPEERATETVSPEPAPVFTTLLNWSSRVTPRPTVPPAVIALAG